MSQCYVAVVQNNCLPTSLFRMHIERPRSVTGSRSTLAHPSKLRRQHTAVPK